MKDFRAVGANRVLKTIYDQYLGQISSEGFIKEASDFYIYLQEYVKNIYEVVINKDIPVFYYLDILSTTDMSDLNIELSKEEALKDIKKIIHEFFSDESLLS